MLAYVYQWMLLYKCRKIPFWVRFLELLLWICCNINSVFVSITYQTIYMCFSAKHQMRIIKYIFIYLSWICLFASVLCILRWIGFQRNTQKNSQVSSECSVTDETRHTKILVMLIKFFLILSIVLLIMHFVFSSSI